MKIAVCIKQVPDTNDVKWNKENNLVREGLTSILNPYDECALKAAVDIKEKNKDVEITVISMGPVDNKKSLEYALAMGADEAVLLCDKRFSGADTRATSKTLSLGILNAVKDFDYIFAGQFATDGDTAQTAPSLAYELGLPVLTYVKNILEIDCDKIKVENEIENEILTTEMKAKGVVCLLKTCAAPCNPKIEDYIRAQKCEIKVLNAEDIKADIETIGIKGSPTFVQRAFRPEKKRWGRKISQGYVNEILSCIKENDG